MDRLCALVATARDTAAGERCITNPVWVAPVGIEIKVGPGGHAGPSLLLRDPAADWDAGCHARVPGTVSFVVYLEHPADLHGNVLNDVAQAFSFPRASRDARAPH